MEIDIELNKKRTLKILKNYLSERDPQEKISSMLERTDYFVAPASTKYHLNVEGGLNAHTLSVWDTMLSQIIALSVQMGGDTRFLFELLNDLSEGNPIGSSLDTLNDSLAEIFGNNVHLDSIVVAVFCHDFHKLNYYFKDIKCQKIGNEWKDVPAFFIRDDHFVMGDSGTTSMYLASQYIKLTYDEALAIENHMGMHDNGTPLAGSSGAWKKSTLACLLHAADLISTFVYER